MTRREYRDTILLEPDPEEGGYAVTVPALPGCITQGSTLEEAIVRAREAIQCQVAGILKDGEPAPEESERPQLVTIDVPIDVPGDAAA